MSRAEYRGSAWAVQQLMEAVQREIDRGERKGVTVRFRKANPAKTVIGWFRRRLIRGEFRIRA